MGDNEANDVLDDVRNVGTVDTNNVFRAIDSDAGVVLYLSGTRIGDGHQGGLTAVPIEDTDLE